MLILKGKTSIHVHIKTFQMFFCFQKTWSDVVSMLMKSTLKKKIKQKRKIYKHRKCISIHCQFVFNLES